MGEDAAMSLSLFSSLAGETDEGAENTHKEKKTYLNQRCDFE